MTENEKLNEALEDFEALCNGKTLCITGEALNMVISAVKKSQDFEAIGTIEEFKALKEKSVAKKVISFEYQNGHINYGCPICKRKIISKIDGEWCAGSFQEHCDKCGQKLDWQ